VSHFLGVVCESVWLVLLFIYVGVVAFVTVETAILIMSVFIYIFPMYLLLRCSQFFFHVMFGFLDQVLHYQHKLVQSSGILFHCF
jgi:hypothetical protein